MLPDEALDHADSCQVHRADTRRAHNHDRQRHMEHPLGAVLPDAGPSELAGAKPPGEIARKRAMGKLKHALPRF